MESGEGPRPQKIRSVFLPWERFSAPTSCSGLVAFIECDETGLGCVVDGEANLESLPRVGSYSAEADRPWCHFGCFDGVARGADEPAEHFCRW